jgi:2,3-bisphosphoglycerate-independent phosphoglycerate mutase
MDGVMEDYSAGHITTQEGQALVRSLQEALGKVTHLRDASRYWVRIPASLLEEKCKGLEKGS